MENAPVPPLSEKDQRPVFPISAWTLEPNSDCVFMIVRFLWHRAQDPKAAASSPTFVLSLEQCAQLAGALQAHVLAMTDRNVTPIRGR